MKARRLKAKVDVMIPELGGVQLKKNECLLVREAEAARLLKNNAFMDELGSEEVKRLGNGVYEKAGLSKAPKEIKEISSDRSMDQKKAKKKTRKKKVESE